MEATNAKILAPVGGHEQLLAAVRCGADAVYFGAPNFNARRGAENFDDAALKSTIAYCREHGVESYVTLNTLLMDSELEAFTATLDAVAEAGADAVIVQDLAVAKLVRERYPQLRMVASTQTVLHNAEGARALEALGFFQGVLARELSLEEIRAVRAGCHMELEAFIHGALCMCVSGACYLSSMLGARSGNRGLCAQPCRTDMRLGERPYALSLKDVSLVQSIRELCAAGVNVFKIEGRMKRPEYVAAAVTACRAALAGEQVDMNTLRAVFSRSGFTDGYYTGKRPASMFGYRTREDVTAAAGVLSELAKTYAEEPQNVPVDMALTLRADAPARLTVRQALHTVTVEGETPAPARSVALTRESAERSLMQTGGTPYRLAHLEADIEEGLNLPVSALKALRRDALKALSAQRAAFTPYACTGARLVLPNRHSAPPTPALRLRFADMAQMFDAPEAQRVILPMGAVRKDPERALALGDRLCVELPALCFPDAMPQCIEDMRALWDMGVRRVLAGNIGLGAAAQELGFSVAGDYGLNILNSAALMEYGRLCYEDVTVSFELSMPKLRDLCGALPRGLIAYGYLPLMKMRACPAKGAAGCGDCTGQNTLIDARRQSFYLECRDRRYTELLNGVPLYIGDKDIQGADFVTLRFTRESQEEARRIYEMFKRHEAPDFERTNGLYFRELL